MAGYLDDFGVKEAQQERRFKQIVVGVLSVAILGAVGYFTFRNYREERLVDGYLAALKSKSYQQAYAMWGCTPQTPCRYYPFEKFSQDWGPEGIYKDAAGLKVEDVDACNAGVVFNIAYPGADNVGLWVDRSAKTLSYAPWSRCPGPHLQVIQYLKAKFGGAKK